MYIYVYLYVCVFVSTIIKQIYAAKHKHKYITTCKYTSINSITTNLYDTHTHIQAHTIINSNTNLWKGVGTGHTCRTLSSSLVYVVVVGGE